MFMTEQGAGSDIAATATRAEPRPTAPGRLTGDKWFCSNADADLAMVLARSEAGSRPEGHLAVPAAADAEATARRTATGSCG